MDVGCSSGAFLFQLRQQFPAVTTFWAPMSVVRRWTTLNRGESRLPEEASFRILG